MPVPSKYRAIARLVGAHKQEQVPRQHVALHVLGDQCTGLAA
jgi:hypothetical protein